MSGIEARARFDIVRYAQVWEDADILAAGLAIGSGDRVLSICSAGDNVLALLLGDPSKVIAVDLSRVQIRCLRLRIAAYRALSHAEMLELMGSRPSVRRIDLLRRCLTLVPLEDVGFWNTQQDGIVQHGLGGIGRFENYFRLFRTRILPLVHGKRTIDSLLRPGKSFHEREDFFDRVWSNRRWRWMLKLFFSNLVMGRFGRDPEFFAHADRSLSDQVASRTRHAFVHLDPSQNPYLHWILKGRHGTALPLSLRESSFEAIRTRLDRVEVFEGPIGGDLFDAHGRFDAFNLSDIFEYMPPDLAAAVHDQVVAGSRPGARILYWNMLVERGPPPGSKVVPSVDGSVSLHEQDKAFFYSAVRLELVP